MSGGVDSLVRMANQIASYYESQPDREEAVAAVAEHIRKFWEPRMRRSMQAHCEAGGEGLRPLATEALARLAAEAAA